MSIVQALIDQVGAEVAKAGHTGRVVGIELVVGRLSGVHADSLRFAFELLSPGSPVEGAGLRISEPEASAACRACRVVSPTSELTMRCPACGSDQITIQGGQELLLQSIDLEDE